MEKWSYWTLRHPSLADLLLVEHWLRTLKHEHCWYQHRWHHVHCRAFATYHQIMTMNQVSNVFHARTHTGCSVSRHSGGLLFTTSVDRCPAATCWCGTWLKLWMQQGYSGLSTVQWCSLRLLQWVSDHLRWWILGGPPGLVGNLKQRDCVCRELSPLITFPTCSPQPPG